MEDWTEANLAKLSVKELKSLARKSNVNPNSKKTELVKALTNVKDIAVHCETGEAQTPRRVTRSRVSIWQASNETSDRVEETKAQLKDEGHLNSGLKGSADDKRVKRKRVRAPANMDAYDTSTMFPLVSSIQLASKPSGKIANNRLEQDKEDEFQTAAAATSKRSKRSKVQNKNIEEVSPSNNKGLNGVASVVNPGLTDESNAEKDCDLNNTFVVNGKESTSQDVNSENRKIKQIEKAQGNEEQNVHPSKQPRDKLTPTQGKKRKFISPVENKISVENAAIQRHSLETSDVVANSHGPSKIRRKKGNEENEITDNFPETSNSKTARIKKLPASNKTKLNDSKKRRIINSPLSENSNNNSESNFSKTDHNKSKSKKSSEVAKDGKSKRDKNKKQSLSIEDESSTIPELTESVETSSNNSSVLQRISRRSGSPPNLPKNESTVMNSNNIDSVKKGSAKKNNNSNGSISEKKDVSAVQGAAAGETPVPLPGPTRDGTFILSDTDGKSPQRRSTRSSPGPGAAAGETPVPMPGPTRDGTFILSDTALETKPSSSLTSNKHVKSIGHRIMQATMKRDEKVVKKEPGSTLKKTIVRGATPGSICKKRPAGKIPNFKKIHAQLFNNMESLSEHKKRLQDRTVGLLSPVVPRCAMLSPRPQVAVPTPRPTNAGTSEGNSHSKAQNTKVSTSVAPSPLATKLKTPVAPQTPVPAQEPVPVASSVNRFGYRRKLVKKEEATSIIKRKQPAVNLDKIKEQNQNVLKGVRKNKRFMLQMQMRQNRKDDDEK